MKSLFAVLALALFAPAAEAAPPSLDMPAPRFAARPACVCGTACVCKPGVCPGGCPVVSPAPGYTLAGYDWRHVPGVGMAWVQRGVTFSPAATPPVVRYAPSNCPGGVCPLPRR